MKFDFREMQRFGKLQTELLFRSGFFQEVASGLPILQVKKKLMVVQFNITTIHLPEKCTYEPMHIFRVNEEYIYEACDIINNMLLNVS